MTLSRTLLVVLSLVLLGAAAVAPACELAGPNTHMGTIVAIDAAQSTLTLRDAQTRQNLTFLARPELLKDVAVKDEVAVVYAQEGGKLRATAIRKAGG
ncbi:MAG: hypothetical protein AUH29_03135 [Candidatus Rokubacteria bacterium 13_1_40CM_69_27]|nr:MAG: hypothetical protein AUH29_03135 [Candidatus Rokubacteria bacterium 13_1_40CM_69_27]OLC31328.1 MAG: hypothetical protein AUH81_18125 [Candidatus Rokubacteria bacterium 13_1_40CM_4_69_5]